MDSVILFFFCQLKSEWLYLTKYICYKEVFHFSIPVRLWVSFSFCFLFTVSRLILLLLRSGTKCWMSSVTIMMLMKILPNWSKFLHVYLHLLCDLILTQLIYQADLSNSNKEKINIYAFSFFLLTCCCDRALTLAKWHWRIPLVDPLCSPGTCGAALTNKPKALVTAETQGAAQLSACKTVHCAIYRVVWRAAVGRYEKIKGIGRDINMHTDKTQFNKHKKPIMLQNYYWGGEGLMCLQ